METVEPDRVMIVAPVRSSAAGVLREAALEPEGDAGAADRIPPLSAAES